MQNCTNNTQLILEKKKHMHQRLFIWPYPWHKSDNVVFLILDGIFGVLLFTFLGMSQPHCPSLQLLLSATCVNQTFTTAAWQRPQEEKDHPVIRQIRLKETQCYRRSSGLDSSKWSSFKNIPDRIINKYQGWSLLLIWGLCWKPAILLNYHPVNHLKCSWKRTLRPFAEFITSHAYPVDSTWNTTDVNATLM